MAREWFSFAIYPDDPEAARPFYENAVWLEDLGVRWRADGIFHGDDGQR